MVVEALPETATMAEFARIIRRKRSWVTALRKADRLVFDGRRVRVTESIERIEATEDPSKRGVAARHAKNRAVPATGTETETQAMDQNEPDPATPSLNDDPPEEGYQHWRARREKAAALQAERDNAKEENKLLDAGTVAGAAESAGAAFRSTLENLVLELAPELAGIADEERIAAILTERFHDMLEDLSLQLERMGKAH